MFSVHDNMDEIRDFTINLVKRTRPYLGENQLKIVAEDLISRACLDMRPSSQVPQDTPFRFGVHATTVSGYSSIKIESSSSSGANTGSSSPVERRVLSPCEDNPARKRRHNKYCTSCNVHKENVTPKNPRKSFAHASPIVNGAPKSKKKKKDAGSMENVNGNGDQNVFERLYAMRKRADDSVVARRKRLYEENLGKCGRKHSESEKLDECIGSVQKALDNLKLIQK